MIFEPKALSTLAKTNGLGHLTNKSFAKHLGKRVVVFQIIYCAKTCKKRKSQKQSKRKPHTFHWFSDNIVSKFLNQKGKYCHSAYLTYMQSTSCEIRNCMNHDLESRLPGEISTTSDMQMIPL